jgi:hypothetical protein
MSVRAHTKFAPAERASWEQLYQQIATLNRNSALQCTLQDAPQRILVLNAQRQIVYANKATLGTLELEDPAKIYGCRPGEVLGCMHADQGEGGCGTSKECRLCGAVNAVLRGLSGRADVQKCKITRQIDAPPLNLVVHSIPLSVAEMAMCLVTLGISDSESPAQIAKNTFTIQHYAALIEQD